MILQEAQSKEQWDYFLKNQVASPFLQSWTMGTVYEAIGQLPIRLEVRENDTIIAICQAILVPARRGRHLAVQYGPVLGLRVGLGVESESNVTREAVSLIVEELKKRGKELNCSFVRMSPFWQQTDTTETILKNIGGKKSPLHLLAEHVWYVPLHQENLWNPSPKPNPSPRSAEEILIEMRKNHRNLIRRAEREGVTITRSADPVQDLPTFIELHEETRKRHSFTPYTNAFFRAQVEEFSKSNECTLYMAHYNDEVIAASVHMHLGGETSYHHGASTHKYSKIPASYLLQWTAMQDAIERGDLLYNFWGIAPIEVEENNKHRITNPKHPFAGVTTFKTGFGGELLELVHAVDIPIDSRYYLTRGFEQLRKWKRGF